MGISGITLAVDDAVSFDQFIAAVDRGGVLGLLVVIIWGGLRGWYVWRWQYKELEQDRDFWRTTALRSLQVTEAAVEQSPPDSAMARRIQTLEFQIDQLRDDNQ